MLLEIEQMLDGWKHGTDIQGNGKKVKCNYCSKIVSGGIFRFQYHLAGTREDSEPCATVPEEVKLLMMKIVVEAKEASLKKRRLNIIGEDDEESEEVETNFFQRRLASKGRGKGKMSTSSGGGVQSTLNIFYF
ncbi:hypothetical protein Fmac_018040 [Flemingia macrophylla]|uniref:BED-type domain-containing protein n=1 Tax=Flemingia macrophylla TaxID=520843 RepID=A0ABD1M3V0_9FABA